MNTPATLAGKGQGRDAALNEMGFTPRPHRVHVGEITMGEAFGLLPKIGVT